MAAPVGSPSFEMRDIRKAFGATRAVDGISLSVAPGEVCALVGQNGAGKSTLMSVLSGALAPDDGAMLLDGHPYKPDSPLDARRAGVAMIYQELSLAPHLSVMENVVLGLEPTVRGLVDWPQVRRTAREALTRLGHGDLPLDTPAGHLSIALQQIVEIARALAVGSRVLVLDEPTSSLGREDTRRLFAIIAQLKREGCAIVYISHFIEEVKVVADRIVVLRDGRVAGAAAPDTPATTVVSLMVGRTVEDLYPRSPRQRADAILEVDAFGAGSATFTLHRGEIFGIAGLLGAGRTRLLRSLFGLEPVREGRVRLAAWTGRPAPRNRWANGMGMLSEDRKGESLAVGLTVSDNLTLSRLERLGPGPFVIPSRQDAAGRTWIERLAIGCRGPRQPVAELSGGNQQKVALARLLHHDVDVLALDEPTRGIDVASKAQIYSLLDALVVEAVRPAARDPAGEQLCTRAARLVRSHRDHAARPSRTAAPGQRADRAPDCDGSDRRRGRGVTTRRLLDTAGPLLGLLFVSIIFGILVGPRFFNGANLELIARQTAIVCTAALGMTMVIVAGGIDLSVGSIVALTTVVIALALRSGVDPLMAAAMGVAAAAVCGLANGLLITGLRVIPFIVTLGMMILIRGAAKGLADERRIEAPNTWLNELLRTLDPNSGLIAPAGIWVVAVLALITAGTLGYTRFGRHLFSIGSNERTARLCGVAVDRTKIAVYTAAAMLAGVAGLLQFSRLSVGDPTIAMGLELDVIAAVIIGGGSLLGGRGSVVGTVLGACTMAVIQTGCTQRGLPNWVQQIVTGAIIILAVALDRWRSKG